VDVSKGNKTATDATRDLSRVATEGWTVRCFPLPGRGKGRSVPVVVKRSVLQAIHEHGCSRTDVEMCGVLVGNVYQDENGPYVYVEAMIQGISAGSAVAQVTFTSATWDYIQDRLDKLYPNLRMIGWYHTHPGFGVFLSDMDLFIHNNFFNAPEQLAFVLDPLSGDQGMFVWRSGKTSREKFDIEEDGDAQSRASEDHDGGTSRIPASASQIEELKAQVARLHHKLRFAVIAFVVVLVLAVAGSAATYWLARRNAPVDGLQEENGLRGQEPPSRSSEAPPNVDGTTLAPMRGQDRHEVVGGKSSDNQAALKFPAASTLQSTSQNTPEARPASGSGRPAIRNPVEPSTGQ